MPNKYGISDQTQNLKYEMSNIFQILSQKRKTQFKLGHKMKSLYKFTPNKLKYESKYQGSNNAVTIAKNNGLMQKITVNVI